MWVNYTPGQRKVSVVDVGIGVQTPQLHDNRKVTAVTITTTV